MKLFAAYNDYGIYAVAMSREDAIEKAQKNFEQPACIFSNSPN